jgi:hypothetical protein
MRNEMREPTMDSEIRTVQFLRQLLHTLKSTYQANDLLLFLDMASSVSRALKITRSAEMDVNGPND